MTDTLFYILAGGLILLSLFAATLPNLLHGAISLIGSFFITAALYIMLRLEFVALSQIMLYIGGIIIFMLIIILLTTGLGEDDSLNRISLMQRAKRGLIPVMFLSGLFLFLNQAPSPLLQSGTHRGAPVTLDDIGIRLLSTEGGFIVAFEVISILLLVALVGAVVIARRDPQEEQS
ncbi:MAG: NADH-quinone oxidoreductase subunit J [Thermodesulfobacteriota bacterium]